MAQVVHAPIADREAAILSLIPLVNRIARLIDKHRNPDEDILGDGYLAAVRAVDLYDPARGALSTFAFKVIYDEMYRGIRKRRLIPERKQVLIQRTNYAIGLLEQDLGRQLTRSEIEARYPGFVIACTFATTYTPKSLSNLIQEPGAEDETFADVIGRGDLDDAIACLAPRQRATIKAHYFEGASITEIAEAEHISQQAASNAHTLALQKLRKTLSVQNAQHAI
jgi:RNA polymerase sigma factor (sigma-70 family)